MERMGYAQTFRNPPNVNVSRKGSRCQDMETTVADQCLHNVSLPSAKISIRYNVEALRCSEIQLAESSTIRASCASLTVEHRQSLGGLESVTLNVSLRS